MAVVTRAGLGRELTWAEGDNNFTELEKRVGLLAPTGAAGNGSTNDLPALNALVSAAVSGGYRGIMLPWTPNSYAVSDTWVIPATLDVIQYGPVKYTGSGNVPCIQIGAVDVSARQRTYRLWAQRATISTWTDEGSVGIDLINPNQSWAEIIEASFFTIGLRVHGLSSASAPEHGATWSQFVLRYFADNKIDVDVVADGPGGYANQNSYYGGSFNASSGAPNSTIDKIGVRLTMINGAVSLPNNNIFIGPSFELHASGRSGLTIPVEIIAGRYNKFIGCRHEANNALFMRVVNGNSWENTADLLFTTATSYSGLISDVNPGWNDVTTQEARRAASRWRDRNVVTTFASTMSWDLYAKPRTTITLTGNATLNVADLSVGVKFALRYTLHVYQDGVGSRVLTLGTNIQFSPATAPLKTAANSLTVLEFEGTGTGIVLVDYFSGGGGSGIASVSADPAPSLGGPLSLNAQTINPGAPVSVGGARDYLAADSGKTFIVTVAGTQTIPAGLPDGWEVDIWNTTASSISIAGATSVTLETGQVATIKRLGGSLIRVAKGDATVIRP